jgi:hypothetical protein
VPSSQPGHAGAEPVSAGTRPVYAAGELALKLYPQADGNASSVEASVLSAIDGALPVAAPRVHATGDWDGWSYLLMSPLPGGPLDVAWPDVPAQGRLFVWRMRADRINGSLWLWPGKRLCQGLGARSGLSG